MTLLEAVVDRDIGNAGYTQKWGAEKPKSQFAITTRLAQENTMWNPQRVRAHRQGWARQATAVWRIRPLDSLEVQPLSDNGQDDWCK